MWDQFILNPMINALLWLYALLGNNFVLAITVFTILVRLVTLPLNLRQQRSSMKVQEMQPQIQAIQKKYRDNPQKMQEEFQKIGYNPAETLSGCLPLLIQFPILIGLYQAIIVLLGATPQALFELTQRVYPGIDLTALLPIANKFLWLNLAQPDQFFVLPILVFATMFVQQKLLTPAPPKNGQNQDNPAAAMSQSMLYTMPIMFGFFSLNFPAGLSIYWILANVIGVVQGLYMKQTAPPATAAPKAAAAQLAEESAAVTADQAKTASANHSSSDSRKRSTSSAAPGASSGQKRPQSKRKRRSAKR